MEWEELFTVHVKIEKALDLHRDDGTSVVMLAFSGTATGSRFNGTVLEGGIDTQWLDRTRDISTLSARYMLSGTDHTGEACRIFIENNGSFQKEAPGVLFRTTPKLITDSKALSFLHDGLCVSEGRPTADGVDITIYRWQAGGPQ